MTRQNPPPDLPFAPTRSKPLSLWNPLDYLLLLYWVFYFPQAIRWYVETFSDLEWNTNAWLAIRQDKIQWRLAGMGLLLALSVPFAIAYLLQQFGISITMLDVAFGVAGGVATIGAILRLDTAFSGGLISFLAPPSSALYWQRTSPLPLPSLQHNIGAELDRSWAAGIHTSEGVLRYTLQYVPVIGAFQTTLNNFPTGLLITKVGEWCNRELWDWGVVRFQSASLQYTLAEQFWNVFFIIPRVWRPQPKAELRYDTPVRAACAAFWLLHKRRTDEAAQGFAHVRVLRHGEELYQNTLALAEAEAVSTIIDIARWNAPPVPADELLRPELRAVFDILTRVAADAQRIDKSRSSNQRNLALNRANGNLTDLLAQADGWPTPERPILVDIITNWREVLLQKSSAVAATVVRERVESPYTVGAWVAGTKLVGREDMFKHIEQIWGKPGQRDSLVIFGQRRVGKTSIVRNLQTFCNFGADTGVAVLNIQSVDWPHGLGDLCFRIAFELWKATPNGLAEPEFEQFAQRPLVTLRGVLEDIHLAHPTRRYVLILDEYEELEAHLPAELGAEFVRMLRGWTQDYPWFVVGLVGLHTLEERSADFFAPIFAWRTLRVGLMNRDAVADILQIESDDFPLEYDLDSITRITELTGGQPLLVQLIGDSLVERFNDQLRSSYQKPRSMFTVSDVEAVIKDNPQFDADSAQYFRGVWRQASEQPSGQIAILQALAPHVAGLPQAALQAASGLDAATFVAAITALASHEVVKCTDGVCRYSVELLRRWVAAGRIA